jgi:hypothetical protein
MMFPTPSPSGVPRKGITTPFIANDVLYGSGLQFVSQARSSLLYNLVPHFPS